MWLNGFSVRVIGGTEKQSGYVELPHDTQYSLALRNNSVTLNCNATVEIDGKPIGTFRITPKSTITIERPLNDKSRFTFYKVGTSEFAASGLALYDPNLGLIKVSFTPEKAVVLRSLSYTLPEGNVIYYSDPRDPTLSTWNTNRTTHSIGVSAGGTGLSGHSGQEFVDAPDIFLDYSQTTTIHLRLVCAENTGPHPLVSYSTPIPPQIH
jgi:hypothetical protein